MDYAEQVSQAFPELDKITDSQLRTKVENIWRDGLVNSDFDDVADLPWWPLKEDTVGDQKQVPHVRDVVGCAIALTDTIVKRRSGLEVHRDLVIAGALLHDISKLHELDADGISELNHWIPHPHYGVHMLAQQDCPLHLQHIVLAHTPKSAVEPRTIEAEIVKLADEIAVMGIAWEQAGKLSV